MYQNNIYIDNYEELSAQYKHWRATVTGVPELMSADDKKLLGL